MRVCNHDYLIVADEIDDAVGEDLDAFAPDGWDSLVIAIELRDIRPGSNRRNTDCDFICEAITKTGLLILIPTCCLAQFFTSCWVLPPAQQLHLRRAANSARIIR